MPLLEAICLTSILTYIPQLSFGQRLTANFKHCGNWRPNYSLHLRPCYNSWSPPWECHSPTNCNKSGLADCSEAVGCYLTLTSVKADGESTLAHLAFYSLIKEPLGCFISVHQMRLCFANNITLNQREKVRMPSSLTCCTFLIHSQEFLTCIDSV